MSARNALSRLRRSLTALSAIALAALLTLPAPALAQPIGRFRDIVEPSVQPRDIELAQAVLDLDEDQRAIIDEMVAAYAERIAKGIQQMMGILEDAREDFSQDRMLELYNDLKPIGLRFADRKDQLTRELYNDIKLVLTEDQLEQWPVVERSILRRRSLGGDGIVTGEMIDLFELLDDVGVNREDELWTDVAPTLEEYAIRMDTLIKQRDPVYEDTILKGVDLFFEQDFGAMQKLLETVTEQSVKLKRLNTEYAERLMAILPDDVAQEFDREFKRDAFPMVYRRSVAERAFDTALQAEGLTEDQRAQIEDLRERHDRTANALNRVWIKHIEEAELERSVQRLMARELYSKEATAAAQARRDHDARTVDKLRDILTEEQAQFLPNPRANEEIMRNSTFGL
jgi:hypothetical protein